MPLSREHRDKQTDKTAHISMRDPIFSAGLLGSAIIDNPPRSAVTLQHKSSSVRLTYGIIGDLDNDSLQWRSYANSTFGKKRSTIQLPVSRFALVSGLRV